MKANALFGLLLAALPLALAGGCGRKPETVHLRHAVPPHGGTPVALGDDFNLELVLDPHSGRMQAYVLDDDMEEFIRISAPSFELVATIGGKNRALTLRAVPNPATGETVGSTSLFEGQADWLKGASAFEVVLPRLIVHDQRFSNLRFGFPQGLAGDGG